MLIQITYKRCIAQAVWDNTLCNNLIFSRRGARLKVHTFYLLKSMYKSHSGKWGFIRAIWTGSSNMEFVGVFTKLPEKPTSPTKKLEKMDFQISVVVFHNFVKYFQSTFRVLLWDLLLEISQIPCFRNLNR